MSWNSNSEQDLQGYRIYYGTSPGSLLFMLDVGNVVTGTVTGLTDGATYYFSLTAYDGSGNESNFSPSIAKTVGATGGGGGPSAGGGGGGGGFGCGRTTDVAGRSTRQSGQSAVNMLIVALPALVAGSRVGRRWLARRWGGALGQA